jgi:hypothetical protein
MMALHGSSVPTLPEALLLLALNDQTGERAPNFVNVSLAGAILAELILGDRAKPLEQDPERFHIAKPSQSSDPVVFAVHKSLGSIRGEVDLRSLINRIAGRPDLMDLVAGPLIARGVLTRAYRRHFLIFRKEVFPEVSHEAEASLKAQIVNMLAGSISPSLRDGALLAMAIQIGLMEANFDRSTLSDHHERIEALRQGRAEAIHLAESDDPKARAIFLLAARLPSAIGPILIA